MRSLGWRIFQRKSNDPTMLLVNLRSTMVIPGFTTSIGSTKLRVKEIEWSHHAIGESTQHDGDPWIHNIHRFDETQSPGLGRTRQTHSRLYPPYSLKCSRLTCILTDISLEMFEMGKKTGVVVVRFTKVESPPVAKPNVSTIQNVGYQSQDVSTDQVICHWNFWVWTFSFIW